MKEKINIEEEVLESTVPEELKVYLEKDNEVIDKLGNVISGLDSDLELLSNQKEQTEKDFEDRLNEFKEQLTKEKEEAFEEFSKKEQDILDRKEQIESIKLEEQGKQVNYIDSLKDISAKCNSKISSIEDAIRACEGNETLTKALEEEKEKMNELLEQEYNKRKESLNSVLKEIGEKVEEETPKEVSEETQSFELPKFDEEYNDEIELNKPTFENNIEPEINNFDYNTSIEPEVTPNNIDLFNEEYDNEVVSHETRKDVISVIYESEDVMEGHVFPYLKSLM